MTLKKQSRLSKLQPISPQCAHRCDYDMRISWLEPELPLRRKPSWKRSTANFPDYLPPRVFLMKMACAEQQDEDCAARVQNILGTGSPQL